MARLQAACNLFECIPITHIEDSRCASSHGDTYELRFEESRSHNISKASDTRQGNRSSQFVKLSGVCCIQGLPILSNGSFDNVAHEITSSALAHVAHLIDSLGAVLNIPLLHPIIPFEFVECTISTQGDRKYVTLFVCLLQLL